MTSHSPLGPLNIGNVVTTGFSLFKSNFATYFKLAAWAYLWLLVPVYGWAKYSMYNGLIARLAFGQLTNQPETAVEARRAIQDRLWNFLVAGILVGLCAFGAYVAFIVALAIGAVIVGVLANTVGGGVAITIGVILGIVAVIAMVLGLIWISGRLFLTEMPIALEKDRVDPTAALGQSWRLSKAAAGRIMTIVFITSLVTLPLSLIVNVGVQLPPLFLPEGSPWVVGIVAISYILSFLVGMVTLPFWQCIKAATYYDLRARREGLDIQLRDRPL